VTPISTDATVHALGFLAGLLTTSSFVPQVVKSWRTRSVDDLSLGMLVLYNIGVAAWLAYGWLLHAPPIIAANGVTLMLALALLGLKLTAQRRR
jgi:MtN3 and saliva related transmembrane protein